ncbi:hypothetical protein QYE76_001535 [Lolium multiflorum]|uniref:Factor of DNA methylation 1-5/IDN2 domain-containing protein n=1 Tax=Lolium multiflorum TaxID=4521 RepID=A0AAD8RM11_LOLMU|nr:hypothetical protein QYE76_001535 [Lolium multiflorum]
MAEPGDARRLPTNLDVLASDVHSKVEFYKNAYMDCIGINNALHGVMEEKGKLQVEQKAVVQLAAEKDKLIAELNTQKDHLTTRNEEQAAEIESLKEQLSERESSQALLALKGSGLQSTQSGKVYIRSKKKRQQHSDGSGEDADYQGLSTELEAAKNELSDIHSKVIKGFIDISSTGGRNIAIKNIGQLRNKPFLQACLKKLTPKEAPEKASELYNFWQKQLLNPDWKPSKTLMDEGISKEIDVHDVNLQELRASWGEEVYKAVVNCLMEIEECGRLTDRTIVPELWNFKENRKATCSECVEYIFSQVKRLNGSKGRTTRRAVNATCTSTKLMAKN